MPWIAGKTLRCGCHAAWTHLPSIHLTGVKYTLSCAQFHFAQFWNQFLFFFPKYLHACIVYITCTHTPIRIHLKIFSPLNTAMDFPAEKRGVITWKTPFKFLGCKPCHRWSLLIPTSETFNTSVPSIFFFFFFLEQPISISRHIFCTKIAQSSFAQHRLL